MSDADDIYADPESAEPIELPWRDYRENLRGETLLHRFMDFEINSEAWDDVAGDAQDFLNAARAAEEDTRGS